MLVYLRLYVKQLLVYAGIMSKEVNVFSIVLLTMSMFLHPSEFKCQENAVLILRLKQFQNSYDLIFLQNLEEYYDNTQIYIAISSTLEPSS